MRESPTLSRQRRVKAFSTIGSAFFAVAAVLLSLMWVRSYWVRDMVFRTTRTRDVCVSSRHGGVIWYSRGIHVRAGTVSWPEVDWHVVHTDLSKFIGDKGEGFQWQTSSDGSKGRVPYWIVVSFAGILSFMSWAFPRFSLRIALILTTIIALFFAAVAASLRN
jgi:hypothetical protein